MSTMKISYKIYKRTVILKLRLQICIVVHFFVSLSYSDGAASYFRPKAEIKIPQNIEMATPKLTRDTRRNTVINICTCSLVSCI